jgi:hypothetical protein
MPNFDKFIFNKNLLPKNNSEREQVFNDAKKRFLNEIMNSEKAKTFFSQYHSKSFGIFAESYVNQKIQLAKHYEYYEREFDLEEKEEIRYQKEAETVLNLILEKKLFNMQLLWRAEKIKIDGIYTSYDFIFWGNHIDSCFFIPPIEEDEVELLKAFLLQTEEDYSGMRYSFSWQDYEEITKKDERGLPEDMPEWYEFYDLRKGTGTYLILPNLRGEKEEQYFNLVRENNKKTSPASQPQVDKRPFFHGLQENILKFARYFETDKYFIELFNYFEDVERRREKNPDQFELEDAIGVLTTADRPIYFPGHLKWDEAIFYAATKYTNTKIAEAVDYAYQEYLLLRNLGMPKGESKEEIMKKLEEDTISKIYHKAILKGRQLNGEPADFDY